MAPKALPPAKINPIKLLGGSSFAAKKISVGDLQDDNITVPKKDLIVIKTQVIKIKDLVKSSTLLKSAEIERKRKEGEKERFSKKEQELETPQNKEEGGKEKVPSLPKLGFLDRIKKFFFNVLLGYVVVRLLPHVNKLPDIVKTVGSAIDFGTDLALGLFNGLVTFIDWGYKAYDATRGFIKTIGGDSTLKVFDAFNGAVGKVIEAAIITSIAIGSQGDGGVLDIGMDMLTDRLMKKGVQQAATGATQAAGSAGGGVGQAAGVGAGAAAGIIAGAGLLASALGEGAFQLKKMSVGMEQGAKKSHDSEKNPLMKPIRWLMYQGAKFISFQLGTVGSLLDIVGTPFRYAIELIRYPFLDEKGKKEQNKNLSKFDARIREQFREGLNALSFGMIGGGGKGSWGSLFGEKGTKGMGYAGGGSPVTRGGKVQGGVKRTVKKAKRSVKVQAPKVRPGASVGGEKKIEKVFPEPENKDKNKVNPLGYMKKSYDTLSSTSGFGGLFGIALKAQLGEKPSDLDYKIAASGLNAWMQNNLATGGAFAEGGSVDAAMFGNSEDMKNVIAKSLEETISKKVDDAINNLMRQLGLPEIGAKAMKDNMEGENGPSLDVGDGGTVTGGNADFWALVAIASLESGNPQGRADVAQSIYNRLSSGIYSGGSIKELIVSGNGRQYQPVGRAVSEFRSISDKESAINAVMIANKLSRSQAEKFINETASAIQNKELQSSAAQFVGGRTDFWAQGLTPPANGIGYVVRNGHRFGWFVGPAAIAYGKKNPGPAKAPALGDIVVMGGSPGTGGMLGNGKFIQGNSGASEGVHFHIGPGSQVKGTILQRQYFADARATAKQTVDFFLSKGSRVYDGRRRVYYKSGNEVDAAQKAHTADGSAGGIDMQVDFEKPVPFPLKTAGMAYRSNGFGVSADIAGSNSFVAHGRYDESGKKAPQTGGYKAYFRGGRVSIPTFATLAEKGPEFVFDADTTRGLDGMAPLLLEKLNVAKTKPQLASILQSYAGYEFGAEKVVEVPTAYSQPVAVPVPVPMGGGGMSGGMSGGSSDSSYDSLYM